MKLKLVIPLFVLLLSFGCVSNKVSKIPISNTPVSTPTTSVPENKDIQGLINKVFGSSIVYGVSTTSDAKAITYKIPRPLNSDDYQSLINVLNQSKYNVTSTAATQKAFMIMAKGKYNLTIVGTFGKDLISVVVKK